MFFQSINKIKSLNKTELTALILIVLAIIFGFLTRIISVFRYVTFDIGPDPDQILGAYVLMDMWQGKLPHLGFPGSGGRYSFSTPPTYIYLVFPFTILGPDPAFQILANACFSFLSILLLMYLVYQLLENVEFSKRLLLAGLAGFWYSTIYAEYFISNFVWGPSPIPFFLILFILLYDWQLKTNKPLLYQVISWLLYGIVLGILISLHSTTLFVMPVVFLLSSLWFVYKNRKNVKKFLLPLLSIFSANLTLAIYWKLEIVRGFANTRKIIDLVLGERGINQPSNNILTRLFKVIFDYFHLGNQVYFLNDKESVLNFIISIIFFSISLYFGISRFKGNKTILGIFALISVIFFYASSNYSEEYFFSHRKILIWFVPILLAISSLAYLDMAKKWEKMISILLVVFIGFSVITNLQFDYRYLSSKYGDKRLMSVNDIVSIFNQIPPNSTICYPEKRGKRKEKNQYDYIDTYMTKRGFKIVSDCEAGDYVLHPKLKMDIQLNDLFPVFTLSETPKIDRKASVYLETPTAYVYKLE